MKNNLLSIILLFSFLFLIAGCNTNDTEVNGNKESSSVSVDVEDSSVIEQTSVPTEKETKQPSQAENMQNSNNAEEKVYVYSGQMLTEKEADEITDESFYEYSGYMLTEEEVSSAELLRQMSDLDGKTEAQINALKKTKEYPSYQRAVIAGIIPADQPKIKIDDFKRLIGEAEELYPYSDPPTDGVSETMVKYCRKISTQRIKYICEKIPKIQLFPDYKDSFGCVYYEPEFVCTNTETYEFYNGVIHYSIEVDDYAPSIRVHTYDDNKKIIGTDKLLDWQDDLSELFKKHPPESSD